MAKHEHFVRCDPWVSQSEFASDSEIMLVSPIFVNIFSKPVKIPNIPALNLFFLTTPLWRLHSWQFPISKRYFNCSDILELTYWIVHRGDSSLQLPSLSPACALSLTMAHARFFSDKQSISYHIQAHCCCSLSSFTFDRHRASLFTHFSLQL